MDFSLFVMVPVTVTDANLTSSTVPENDYAAWSGATTYGAGAFCISATTHRIYESAIAGNLNHDPTDLNNQFGTTIYWVDKGATNRHKMFDTSATSQTIGTSPMTTVFHGGFFNAFTALEISGADTISVVVKDAPGGNVVFSYSGSLEASAPPDYYEYWFDGFSQQTDIVLNNIDQYNDAELTVTLTAASGNIGCGMQQFGDLRPLGVSQYGAKAKPKTYSYIKINDFGEAEIIRRNKGKDMEVTARLSIEEANAVLEVVNDLLDVPCLWVGSPLANYTGLRCFGLGSGELSYDDYGHCMLTITVKGLI